VKIIVNSADEKLNTEKIFSHQDFIDENNFLSIGRSKDSHIVLDNAKISRNHFRVYYHPMDGWRYLKCSEVNSHLLEKSVYQDIKQFCYTIYENLTIDLPICQIIFQQIVEENKIQEQVTSEKEEVSPVDGEQQVKPFATDSENSFDSQEKSSTNIFGDQSEMSSLEEGNNLDEFSAEDSISDSSDDNNFVSLNEQSSGFQLSGEEMSVGFSNNQEDRTQVLGSFLKYELQIFGDYAPYDRYVIDKDEVFVGRDEDCDIKFDDPEISGRHAKFFRQGMLLGVEDLKSSNGTLLNGKRVNKDFLQENDEVVIGSTTFTIRPISEQLDIESERLMPVENIQTINIATNSQDMDSPLGISSDPFSSLNSDDKFASHSNNATSSPASKALFPKDAFKDPEKRKKIIYILAGLVFLFVILYEEDNQAPKVSNKTNKAEEKSKIDDDQSSSNLKKNIELTQDQIIAIETSYQLARQLVESGKYREAISEINKVEAIQSQYKEIVSLKLVALEGLAKIEEIDKKEQQELEKRLKKEKVNLLLEKLRELVKERRVEIAEGVFQEISVLDPENYEVSSLKLELENWKKEQERIAIEKAQKEAERKRMENLLSPSKQHFMKKEWFLAIKKLEKFFEEKGVDQDIKDEAKTMYDQSQKELDNAISPVLGKAKSDEESLDYKNAYEGYKKILTIDPSHEVSLNKMTEIKDKLKMKSQKVFREALISESLSLFKEAKEKFIEVKQISPSDSEYYLKAEEKLKKYYE